MTNKKIAQEIMPLQIDLIKFKNVLLFTAVITIGLIAWIMQVHIELNRDVSWLIEASSRLFNGGTYAQNFFENNPPWILYFYLPVVILHQYVSLNFIVALRLFVFAFACLSLSMSYYFLKQILKNNFLSEILLVVLTLIFFILPLSEFGQREHLLLLGAIPYCFMIAYRLEGYRLNPYLAFAVGLFGGSVFILKPYFLISLVLIECYFIFCKRKFSASFRPEIFALLSLLTLYMLLLVVRHKDYLEIVMPFALHWCGKSDHEPLTKVFLNDISFYCMLAGVIYLILKENFGHYAKIINILAIALLGFYLSYLIQQITLYYHMLPAYSVALLLLVFLINTSLSHSYKAVFLAILALPFFMNYATPLEVMNFFHPLLLASIYLTLFAAILFFSLRKVSALFLSIAVFTMPFILASQLYSNAIDYKNNHQPLVSFFDQYANNQSVLFFTSDILDVYPTILYSINSQSISRFSYFWSIGGMIKQSYLPMSDALRHQYTQDTNTLINMITEDLHKNPKLVFVDTRKAKNKFEFQYLDKKTLAFKEKKIDFDYIKYFSTHESFRSAWNNYHYFTSLEKNKPTKIDPWHYSLKVYYRTIPKDEDMYTNNIYIYTNEKNALEYAVVLNNDIYRLPVLANEPILDNDSINAIKADMARENITPKDIKNLFAFIAKQKISEPYYKFDVYERNI